MEGEGIAEMLTTPDRIRTLQRKLYHKAKQDIVREIQSVQSSDHSGLANSACLAVKDIGKPCAGKPHARYDEGGLAMVDILYFGVVARD